MCEVTKYNFDQLYNQIETTLRKAVFISVDCEFSALFVGNHNKGSLFDTPSQRYQKLRKNLENSIPLEIGLTAFSFDRDETLYVAKPYKFYVFPAHFGNLDKVFACQSSGFHFLSEYKFDFNKVIYSGIPFLNLEKEQIISKHINDGKLYEYCKYSLDGHGQGFIRTQATLISEWFYSQKDEKEKIVCDINYLNVCLVYILHKDIRTKYPQQLWTYEENQQLKVKRVTPEEYKELNSKISLENQILLSTLGFTRIYRLLVSLKKPLVGHNFLNDIVLLINTFECTMPQSYSAFKQLTHNHFPTIFDTKTISFELFKELPEEKKWKSNGLQELYEYFKNETGRHLVPGSPRIELAEDFKNYTDDKFHDAGWDAYCTGYCFIRMAHFFTVKNNEQNNRSMFVSSEHLKALDSFKNHINIIRATTPYLNLSDTDPISLRPPCLIIQSTNQKPVDIFKVTELLREYGSVDIKPHSCKGRRAIVAVANYGSARRILGRFQSHDDFKVITYNSIKHSPVIRAALWGGAIASGSVLAWLLHSQIMKSS